MKIAFWPHTHDDRIASYRMRCASIVSGLQAQGLNVQEVSSAQAVDVLVLSKRYDDSSLRDALSVRTAFGTKVVLDLCDNHFYHRGENEFAIRRAAQLSHALESVDFVVASSAYLAGQLAMHAKVKRPVEVLDDVIEPPLNPRGLSRFLNVRAEIEFGQLNRKLKQLSTDKMFRLVWFGNSGGGFVNGGMEDLLKLRPVLERLRATYPISLTIVSNSRSMFDSQFHTWKVPVLYCSWARSTISRVLGLHGVSLLPIHQTPFTLAKTANRVVSSLMHGLVVIADQIPSYASYADQVLFDDFDGALHRVFSDVAHWRRVSEGLPSTVHVVEHNKKIIAAWGAMLNKFTKVDV